MSARIIQVFGNSYLAGRRLSFWRLGFLAMRDVLSRPFLTARPSPLPSMADIREICVAKPDYLGDLLMVVPTFQFLRKIAPQAKINLVVGRWTVDLAEFLRENGMVDEVVICDLALLDRGNDCLIQKGWREICSRISAIRTLKEKKIDLFFDFRPFSPNSWSIGVFSGAKFRMGFGLRGMSFTYHCLIPFDDSKPMGQLFLDSIRSLGCEVPQYCGPNIPTASNRPRDIPREKDDSPYLIVQLYSGETKRNLRPAEWRRILDLVHEKFHIVLIGSKADEEAATRDGLCLPEFESLFGKTTIPQLLGLVEESAGVLSVDSVSAHMGLAYGKKVAVLMIDGISDRRSYPIDRPNLAFFSGSSAIGVCSFLSSEGDRNLGPILDR